MTVMTIGITYVVFWKMSNNKFLPILLLIILFGWSYHMSMYRQELAMSAFLLAFLFYTKKNYLLTIIFIYLSTQIHSSAYIALLFAIIAYYTRIKNRMIWVLLISFSFIVALFNLINLNSVSIDMFNVFIGFSEAGNRYGGYVYDIFERDNLAYYYIAKSQLPVTILAIYLLLILKKTEINFLIRIFLIYVISSNFLYHFSFMFRTQLFLGAMSCVSVPYMIDNIAGKYRSVFVLFFTFFVILCSWVSLQNVLNYESLIYKFFFQI